MERRRAAGKEGPGGQEGGKLQSWVDWERNAHRNLSRDAVPSEGVSGCLFWRFETVSCSVVSDFATPQSIAQQVPLSMGFFRQEYWSWLPGPPPEDLPNPGIKPTSLICLLPWQAGSLPLAPPGKPHYYIQSYKMLNFKNQEICYVLIT